MKNQNFKHLLLGICSAGFLLSTSANAGFEFTAPVTPNAPAPQGNQLTPFIEDGDMLPPVVSEPLDTMPMQPVTPARPSIDWGNQDMPAPSAPVQSIPPSNDMINIAPAPMAPRAPSATDMQYEMAVGFGSDLPLVTALKQVVPSDYTYALAGGVDGAQQVSWNGGQEWPVVLNDMISPIGLSSTIEGQVVTIHPNGMVKTSPAAENMNSMQAMTATPASNEEMVAPQPLNKDAAKQGTYVNPAVMPNEPQMETPVTNTNAQAVAPQINWMDNTDTNAPVSEPTRSEGPSLTAASEPAPVMPMAEPAPLRKEDIVFNASPALPQQDLPSDRGTFTPVAPMTVEEPVKSENIAQTPNPTTPPPVELESMETEQMISVASVPATTPIAAMAPKSPAIGKRSMPVLDDEADVPLLKRESASSIPSLRLQPNQSSFDNRSPVASRMSPAAPVAPDTRMTPIAFDDMQQETIEPSPAATVSQSPVMPQAPVAAASTVQQPAMIEKSPVAEPVVTAPVTQGREWTAQSGTSLKDALTAWSRIEGAELVWSGEYDYILTENVTVNATYATAVQTLLEDFANENPAPKGRLHPNLPNGPAVLVINTNEG